MIPRHLIIGVVVIVALALMMSIYAWHVRVRTEAFTGNTQPVAAPVSGPTEEITLFVAYDDPGVLRARVTRIPLPAGRQERSEELCHALLNIYLDKPSPHPLAVGSEVRNVYLVDPGLAVIDLNSAFANGHRSGVLVEELTLASLIATLSANVPGITRVRVLVDGEPRETLAGHADLSSLYEVSAVNQLASQLETSR